MPPFASDLLYHDTLLALARRWLDQSAANAAFWKKLLSAKVAGFFFTIVNRFLTGFSIFAAKDLCRVLLSRREIHLVQSVYLSTRAAANRLSIGASTLKKLRVNGGGPAFHRIGRRVVYSTDLLDEWAKRATFESTSEYRRVSRHAGQMAGRAENRHRARSGCRDDALPAASATAEVISGFPSNPKSDPGEIILRGREHTNE